MTAVVSPAARMKRRALSATCLPEEEPLQAARFELATKKRKRSTSSTRSVSSGKRHKKKKKKRKHREDPPSPRVNPIFLWVKQDDTKIVEVLCEDYDKRNRITLTKTAGGWRAIPHTDRLSRQSSSTLLAPKHEDDHEAESELLPQEPELLSEEPELSEDPDLLSQESQPLPTQQDDPEPAPDEEPRLPKFQPESVEVPPSKPELKRHTVDIYEFHEDSEEEFPPTKQLCESDKCCENVVPDENHNTYSPIVNTEQKEPDTLIGQHVDRELEDLIDELEESSVHKEECKGEIIQPALNDICMAVYEDVLNDAEKHVPRLDKNCSDLMDELEEMCHEIDERLSAGEKLEEETSQCMEEPKAMRFHEQEEPYCSPQVVEPSSEQEVTKEEQHHTVDVLPVPQPPSIPKPIQEQESLSQLPPAVEEPTVQKMEPEPILEPQVTEKPISPINLVVDKQVRPVKEERESDLCSVYRLPEGTTIHKSNILNSDTQRMTTEDRKRYLDQVLNIAPQEEPLNLGKEKVKVPLPSPPPAHSKPKITVKKEEKMMKVRPDDVLKTMLSREPKKSRVVEKMEKELDPVAQLKEVLADPSLVVPDPLLVPRARLPALVANPAKEIPSLLLQNRAYGRLDADLLVVSLSHLQSMMQNCKSYGTTTQAPPPVDPMLWLPYLGQLDAVYPPDLLTSLPYPYRQPYPYDYQQFNVWHDMMQKPNLAYKTSKYPCETKPTGKRKSSGSLSCVAPMTMMGGSLAGYQPAGGSGASLFCRPEPPKPRPEPPPPQPQPKLKVKDLVDPNFRPPQLLKFDETPHPLWHPLFSRQESGGSKPYGGWQWTTPVTVNGD